MSFTHNNGHRAHDSALLAKRWAALAKRVGLGWKKFAAAADFPVFFAESLGARTDLRPTIYLSAGVHGDEAAAPWGLLEWAEEHVAVLRANRILIFPCLNPHGLVNNTRVDQRGVDLNRTFNKTGEPLIAAWRKAIGDRDISLALCLHEDYDAQGCYIYELRRKPGALAPKVLRDCAKIIPTDTRGRIDGRNIKNGHFLRRGEFDLPDLPGLPEAIVLHQLGSEVTLTFESPSEFSLLDRIAVQKEFIQSALKHELGI
jgi:protein MpaA